MLFTTKAKSKRKLNRLDYVEYKDMRYKIKFKNIV